MSKPLSLKRTKIGFCFLAQPHTPSFHYQPARRDIATEHTRRQGSFPAGKRHDLVRRNGGVGWALNLPVLEMAVMSMHNAHTQAQAAMFNSVLTQFKEHPQAWTRCHMILEQATQDHTKWVGCWGGFIRHSNTHTHTHKNARFFALQILQDLIKTQWRVLPAEQTQGIKNFILGMIIQLSQSFEILEVWE
jgi:hypothetical protein